MFPGVKILTNEIKKEYTHALEIRKDKNGKIRNLRYGRYKVNGKRYCVNLEVEIRGKIQATLKQFAILHSNFIKVKTSQTGAMVEIPIWPTLRTELLEAQKSTKKLEGYVYPEQPKMYQENPDGITFHIKRVLNEAGF